MITKVTTKSHEEWLSLRKNYIGGSDAASVVGMNPFRSPYALWAEKTGRMPGFEGNLATEVGAYLEDFVAKKFTDATGKKVRNVNQSFLNDAYPFAIANIDREVVGEDAGLEIKTTDSLNMKKFQNGEYPSNYYVQCVHYLAVTGKKRWYLAVLIGNRDFKWFTIERDEDEIAALMTEEAVFWDKVRRDVPPGVDGLPSTGEALNTVFASSDGGTVDLSKKRIELVKLMALDQQISDLKKMREEAVNNIKVHMGEASHGKCHGFKVSWKPYTRQTFDRKRFEKENPRIDLKPYYNETMTRTFRVSEESKK